MIYFFCVLLFVALVYGKADGMGAFALAIVDLALIAAILFLWCADKKVFL
ncbi:hypothetical protein IEC338SC_3065 [Acinetobacter pittii]|uniref:DUF1328 domain-containing protein n=1 Tax=Acinetobacter pittii TaxID=48296 RepID=A0AB33BI81_ACIPI|nr:hypothetical protein [Acinetobacter pittii]AMX20180.1 hypothetical protein IEC338SC_3065 [Acinetobacter pittii]